MLIQKFEGDSLAFKNTLVTMWNYGVQTNLYWLQRQNKKGDIQLIYQARIYAN